MSVLRMSWLCKVHFRSKKGESRSGFCVHPLSNNAFFTHGYHPVITNTCMDLFMLRELVATLQES